MKVSHETRKRSSERWMGCNESERRQNLDQNPKREEEFEDLDPDDNDEEDMYFEIENSHATSTTLSFGIFNLVLILMIILHIQNRLLDF
jgi:hypothetical protein